MAGPRFLELFAKEGLRYTASAALALGVDFGTYVGLIGLGVHYLAAAPVGFVLGLATVYVLSITWVFDTRRLASAGLELAIFAGIGVLGVLLNQVVIYTGVEGFGLSYERAKLASAVLVFGFNFGLRKLLLFTPRADEPRGERP